MRQDPALRALVDCEAVPESYGRKAPEVTPSMTSPT